jgi:hypothetical protein
MAKKRQTPEDEARSKRLEAAAAKYGENRWWESDDPWRRAAYQLLENTMMYDFQQFARDVALLLGQQESDFVQGSSVNFGYLYSDHAAQVARAKQYLAQEHEHLYLIKEDGSRIPYEPAPYGGQCEQRPARPEREPRPERPPRT